MQEASGNLTDATGNGWSATASGGLTYGVVGPTINGQDFDAITFDGINGVFTISSTLTDPATTGFTVSAWVKHPTGATIHRIFYWNQTDEGTFYLRKDASDRLQIVTVNTVNTTHGNAAPTAFPNDTWVWVAGRYDTGGTPTLRGYHGTTTADVTAFTGTWKRDGNPVARIGGAGGEYFGGEICHLAYWNSPLTDANMTSLRTGI